MNRLFGSARKATQEPTTAIAPTATTPGASTSSDMAAESLTERIELVEKREAHLRRMMDKQFEKAREHSAAGRKREALEYMRKKKMTEGELERLEGKKFNLLEMESKLREARFENEIIEGIKQGTNAIAHEIKKLGGVDAVDAVHDRADDMIADVREVTQASRPIGEAGNMDEDELLGELEAFSLERELRDVSGVPSSQRQVMPQPVPTNDPAVERQKAERARKAQEEREMQAELAALEQSFLKVEQPMPSAMSCVSEFKDRSPEMSVVTPFVAMAL